MTRFTSADAFRVAERFVGVHEFDGALDNPFIMAMLRLDQDWPEGDETPWCSAFMNLVCWLCRLPRSKDLRARSWLNVGFGIPLEEARIGDIVIFTRGAGQQPGPDVIAAAGHVGFYAGTYHGFIEVLGGNQGDEVNISRYPRSRLLGVRRLD